MPEQKDSIIAAFGASAALAGLLLVFIGFVYVRGESYSTVRGDRFKWAAKAGTVPFLVTLACAWCCFEWLTGSEWAYWWSILFFRIGMIATAFYGTATMILFL
jgi:hypothetical protein